MGADVIAIPGDVSNYEKAATMVLNDAAGIFSLQHQLVWSVQQER
jgi:hypothetical protein